MITIKVSYETMIKRITKRGRKYELIENDPSLISYYKKLLKYYNDWMNSYSVSPLLVLDGDQYDFVGNMTDQVKVLELIEERLLKLKKIPGPKIESLKEKHHILLK